MFPIRDDNPTFLTPYATYALIAANVAVWVLVQGLGASPVLERSLCELALIPGELLHSVAAGTRVQIGANAVCELSSENRWLTPLTSMFMHGGWMHIIGNMWFLWIFGDNVEDAMGSVRFAVFYVLCGLAAAAAQIVSEPTSTVPMVGASGAIGGVMGAYVLLYPRVRVHMLIFLGFFITTIAVPAVLMLGYWFFVQLLSGVMQSGTGGGVAFWAHVGGFLAGSVLIFAFRDARLLERHPYHGWNPRAQGPYWRRIDRQ
ncbi:MAG: rhomboid family intramembrane serine protease [Gammaproteobacteria bacterium]|jgi:membrane associated rhomboid family serine protease